MAVFTDLEDRCTRSPFNLAAYRGRLLRCREVAARVALVHVTGRERAIELTIQTPPHEIPTSVDAEYYTNLTRHAERLLDLPNSAYFYAGRAHPEFGNAALAFASECEATHTGSATPFDTGGLVHPMKRIRVRLNPTDGEAERIQYGKASEIPLDQWRAVFGRVLAAYFDDVGDYWTGRPQPWDPEGLYELNAGPDWRGRTFKVRFYEGQPINDRKAWCADGNTMQALRRLQDAQVPVPPGDPPSALDRFLSAPALEPAGIPDFCDRLEQWVREQVRL